MTPTCQNFILKAVYIATATERAELATVPPPRDAYYRRNELNAYGIKYRPSDWLNGTPTPAESAAISRAVRALADRDLVRLTVNQGSNRILNIELTEQGEALARTLLENPSND